MGNHEKTLGPKAQAYSDTQAGDAVHTAGHHPPSVLSLLLPSKLSPGFVPSILPPPPNHDHQKRRPMPCREDESALECVHVVHF